MPKEGYSLKDYKNLLVPQQIIYQAAYEWDGMSDTNSMCKAEARLMRGELHPSAKVKE